MHFATQESVALVITGLGHYPRGLSRAELAEELGTVLAADEVRAALCTAVNDDRVRYAYRKPGALALADGERDGEVVYFAGDRPVYSVGTPDEVNQVLQFLAQPVEGARTQALLAGTWTAEQDSAYRDTREVTAVYEHFEGKIAPPVIGYALNVLRDEGVLQFAIDAGGIAFFKVIGMHRFTVTAHDLVEQKLRWFHVRAGSAAKAMEKVQSIAPGGMALDIQGAALEWLTYTPAPDKSFRIERL
jgi:hypothetical protein